MRGHIKRGRGGSRNTHKHGHAIIGGKGVVKPPALKPGQLRCPACRNAVTPTTRGMLRAHSDLHGDRCYQRLPEGVTFHLDELPPVVIPATNRPPRRTKTQADKEPRMALGTCHDCGTPVTGERWFCGPCGARRW